MPSSAVRSVLLHELMQAGFEGFTEEDDQATGYAAPELLSGDWENILREAGVRYTVTREEEQNWNRLWEAQFEPVIIERKIYIRASFHPPAPPGFDEMVINPRMSFGTGHHETTGLMLRMMLRENFRDKRVIDMGTGTGILAVWACKAGARDVFAADIDRWAFENAKENVELNGCREKIKICHGDVSVLQYFPKSDYFLANINRNILLQDMEAYVRYLSPGGKLIMSGFYRSDLPLIENKANTLGMKLAKVLEENDWTAALFV